MAMILNQFLKLTILILLIILFASCTKRLDATFRAENDHQAYLTLKSDGTFQGKMTIATVSDGQKSAQTEIIPLQGKYTIQQNNVQLMPEMIIENVGTQSRGLTSQPFEMTIQNDNLKTKNGVNYIRQEKAP